MASEADQVIVILTRARALANAPPRGCPFLVEKADQLDLTRLCIADPDLFDIHHAKNMAVRKQLAKTHSDTHLVQFFQGFADTVSIRHTPVRRLSGKEQQVADLVVSVLDKIVSIDYDLLGGKEVPSELLAYMCAVHHLHENVSVFKEREPGCSSVITKVLMARFSDPDQLAVAVHTMTLAASYHQDWPDEFSQPHPEDANVPATQEDLCVAYIQFERLGRLVRSLVSIKHDPNERIHAPWVDVAIENLLRLMKDCAIQEPGCFDVMYWRMTDDQRALVAATEAPKTFSEGFWQVVRLYLLTPLPTET